MLTQLNTMSYFKKVSAKSLTRIGIRNSNGDLNAPFSIMRVFCVANSTFMVGCTVATSVAPVPLVLVCQRGATHHQLDWHLIVVINLLLTESTMTTSIDILDITNTRDTLLIQAHAIASVISNNENLTEMPSEYITNALWCVSEHLEQIQKLNLKLDQVVRTNCDVRAL